MPAIQDEAGNKLFDGLSDFFTRLSSIGVNPRLVHKNDQCDLLFDLSYSRTIPTGPHPLKFSSGIAGLAGISSSSEVFTSSQYLVRSTVGIDLSPLGDGFVLSSNTLLSAIASDLDAPGDDFTITLSDGTSASFDVAGALTIGDLIQLINTSARAWVSC